jgi:hypothetical protein
MSREKSVRHFPFWSLLCVAAASGCGGRTPIDDEEGGAGQSLTGTTSPKSGDDEDDSGGAGPTPTGDDGSITVDFGVCPPAPPAVDTSCNVPGTVCVFGSGAVCQAILCTGGGIWAATAQGC